jgi:hypothetical protein
MHHAKRLGIFVKSPAPGAVKTRLTPPLSSLQACELYVAFLRDLFRRLSRLKGTRVTVFHTGGDAGAIERLLPEHWALEPQVGGDLGERLAAAFDRLSADADRAVIIGSDSPDLPVQYIRRAFQKLKHKDTAVGPATDGGYYLLGLRGPEPALFEGVRWSGESVLADTLANVEKCKRSLAMLPVWYDVDDSASLRILESMVAARRLEGRDRLTATEAVLRAIRG